MEKIVQGWGDNSLIKTLLPPILKYKKLQKYFHVSEQNLMQHTQPTKLLFMLKSNTVSNAMCAPGHKEPIMIM